jgi:hypothetical protein
MRMIALQNQALLQSLNTIKRMLSFMHLLKTKNWIKAQEDQDSLPIMNQAEIMTKKSNLKISFGNIYCKI